jgi:hypothetical protein
MAQLGVNLWKGEHSRTLPTCQAGGLALWGDPYLCRQTDQLSMNVNIQTAPSHAHTSCWSPATPAVKQTIFACKVQHMSGHGVHAASTRRHRLSDCANYSVQARPVGCNHTT